MSRASAEITPTVSVLLRPNGLPIAKTQLPILAASESPHSTIGSGSSGSILMSARSVFGSVPFTSAV